MSNHINRRQFLATAAAAAATGFTGREAQAQQVGKNISRILSGYKLTQGRTENASADEFVPFLPNTELGGKPYVMVFGFNQCQFCTKIGGNLAQLRAYMDSHGKENMPIVVVNTKPETDKDKLSEYVESYKAAGVCGDGQYGKSFFIAFPENRDKVHQIETAVGGLFNKADPSSHPLKIAVMDANGSCVAAEFGARPMDLSDQGMKNLTNAINRLPAPARSR